MHVVDVHWPVPARAQHDEHMLLFNRGKRCAGPGRDRCDRFVIKIPNDFIGGPQTTIGVKHAKVRARRNDGPVVAVLADTGAVKPLMDRGGDRYLPCADWLHTSRVGIGLP